MRRSSYTKCVLAGVVAGLWLIGQPIQADARHSRHVEWSNTEGSSQTVQLGRRHRASAEQAEKDSLQERVAAILQEEQQPVEVKGLDVPTTVSAYDDSIIGTPLASQQQCVAYLLSVNPNPNITVSPQELVSYYYEEGAREGIRPDVAFAQALKETGFFRYGGTVTPDQNNYCGLGTTSTQVKGAYFESPKLGVRAQIQHLLAYASTRMPSADVVDPRYQLVRSSYGSHTIGSWSDLNGRWAVPGYNYGQSIMSMFRSMLTK